MARDGAKNEKRMTTILGRLKFIPFVMGANKPLPPDIKPGTSKLTYFFIICSALLIVVLIEKLVLERGKNGSKLNPKEEEKLQKRLKEIDESEQYALCAIEDGWYPCLHSGQATYFLKAGEVWKYGVTSKGETGRYKDPFLFKNRVSYIRQFTGSFSECLKQEQIKLFHYPYLPENLARPPAERLPRPPYNSIMR